MIDLAQPMTEHERALFLAGVEWMRSAACATVARDMDGRSFPAQLALMDVTALIEGIDAPALQPARIGIRGDG